MKMRKKIGVILSLFLSIMVLGACSSKTAQKENKESSEKKTVKVCVPDGVPSLSIAKMIKENPSIDKNIQIKYEVEKTPDILASKVLKKEADIAIVPSNLSAQAYNKNLPYKLAATSGFGSFFLVSSEKFENFNDLKGKEIYSMGKGLTPDIVFKNILNKNNINPDKDVNIKYLNAATELAPAFISGKAKIAIIPEPMLSKVLMKKKDSKISFDLNKEWMKINNNKLGYPQSSLIVKKELLDNNKDFINGFLDKYKDSVNWANNKPEDLSKYAKELKLNIKDDKIIKNAIKRANMKYTNINDSKKEYKDYFKVLAESNPKSIGGKIPDEGLYMEK
ncbi:ABC transporter substrate-binding protein [Clostridium oceanicum]|uniref:ABC transporter substrate-binding protein n=1 Tax=Clostridium oceanicum TaxID=1543 RepID=A0ABN1JUB1_9CLOT